MPPYFNTKTTTVKFNTVHKQLWADSSSPHTFSSGEHHLIFSRSWGNRCSSTCRRFSMMCRLLSLFPNGAAVCGAPSKPASVAITPSKAQEFLAKLNRPKRNIWDRSQSDVQQWIQQFMYMGFDEQVYQHFFKCNIFPGKICLCSRLSGLAPEIMKI